MITPAFDLSQDSEFLILSIRVPYTRTSEFDLYIDGTDFKFFAKPYFLKLTLPGRIVEDGREKATFDIDKGLFSLRVPKETTGEHFEGLQLLTSLLAPKGSRSAKPLVEDVSTTCSNNAGDNEEQEEDDEEDEFDWQIEQQVYEEISEEELRGLNKYGFGNQRSGVFARLQEELGDVIDIKNPEGTTAAERRQRRLEAEASAFSADHYLADRFEDDEIQGLLKFKPWWTKLQPASDPQGEAAVSFTSDEKAQLRKFSNRSYLLDKTSRHQAWLSLVDILLAYSYEVRSTEGEHNVESPWTIRKLSGTLCWLETFNSLRDVLVSFGRRAVCFPLYRHFSMVTAALRDTVKILHSGRACVLKCLLDIHRVFRENDPAYILNDLYITDYCIWIQRVKSKKVLALATTLEKVSLKKKDLELELEELEEAATLVAEEEEEEEEENEEGASRSDAVSRGDSSSSESSDESDDSEAEGQDCTDPSEEEGGGRGGGGVGGGGGGTSKDSPPQPRPTNSTSSQVPRELPNTLLSAVEQEADAHPSVSPSSRRLIQDLEERVAEELRITQGSHSGDRAERSSSEANATTAQTEATPGRSCTRTLLEPSPRKNPLLIVQTQETDD